MASVGLAPPPAGQEPQLDFHGPSSPMLALQITAIVISSLFAGTRIFARAFLLKSFGWDDAWLTAALCFAIFFYVSFTQASRYGLGRHEWDIPLSNLKPFYMWLSITEIAYLIPSCLLRISLFLSLVRIFNVKTMKYLCWAGMFFCFGSYVGVFFGTLFTCDTVRRTFDITAPGDCKSHTGRLAAFSGFVAGFTDLYITMLPMPYIWRLQVSMKQKLQIGGIFGLGIFCSANSFVRTALTAQSVDSSDATYTLWKLAILATLELIIGFVVASCLVAPALLRTVARPWAESATTLVKKVLSSGRTSTVTTKTSGDELSSGNGSSEVSYDPGRKEARARDQANGPARHNMNIVRTDEARVDTIAREWNASRTLAPNVVTLK